MKYIAVFKSLSGASRMMNRFNVEDLGEVIKTPRALVGGCSYSVEFYDDKMDDVKKYTDKNKNGFLGIYKQKINGSYESFSK